MQQSGIREARYAARYLIHHGKPGRTKYNSQAWALKFLWDWVETARATGLTPLGKAADLINKHAGGMLNHLMHSVTNAAAEGVNSVIQSLKHTASGLPRFESLRTQVLFFLGS